MFHSLKKTQNNESYIMQSLCQYNTYIHSDTLRQAWRNAQFAFPSLRLRFEWGSSPKQIIGIVSFHFFSFRFVRFISSLFFSFRYFFFFLLFPFFLFFK